MWCPINTSVMIANKIVHIDRLMCLTHDLCNGVTGEGLKDMDLFCDMIHFVQFSTNILLQTLVVVLKGDYHVPLLLCVCGNVYMQYMDASCCDFRPNVLFKFLL